MSALLQTTVVLLGPSEDEKLLLAEALTEHSTQRHVRLATSLPLQMDNGRPEIDFLVFMVSMQHRPSLDSFKASLHHLETQFTCGRTIVVILHADDESKYAFPMRLLDETLSTWEFGLVYGNLDGARSIEALASSLARLTESTEKATLLSTMDLGII